MVLVDTSVWIRGLAGEARLREQLDALLAGDEVAGHELVYGELLIGDRGGHRAFLDSYNRMHRAEMVPHEEIVTFVHARELHGRGIGWIDVHLLASAIASRMRLWTADRELAGLAANLGIAYQPRA